MKTFYYKDAGSVFFCSFISDVLPYTSFHSELQMNFVRIWLSSSCAVFIFRISSAKMLLVSFALRAIWLILFDIVRIPLISGATPFRSNVLTLPVRAIYLRYVPVFHSASRSPTLDFCPIFKRKIYLLAVDLFEFSCHNCFLLSFLHL